MLSPSTNDSITRLEERLATIKRGSEAQALQLPQSISDFSPGVEVALLQLIATWSAFSQEKRLVTGIANGMDSQKSLAALGTQAYGRMALLAAKSVSYISGEPVRDPRSAVPVWDSPPLGIRDNGASASLIMGAGADVPRIFAPFLNLSIEGMRAEKRAHFTKHVAEALTSFCAKARSAPIRGSQTDLPDILYELFANAEEWGCTNAARVQIRLPLRGILFRLHRRDHLRIAAEDSPLVGFLQRERSNSACSHLLEVSVFDSGIGLAQRYLRREIPDNTPVEVELQAVRDCFAKHGSSSGNTSRGLGLYYVMLLANQLQGFLRLRTGRLHLYRDFQSEPYLMPQGRQEDVVPRSVLSGFQYLRDWNTGSSESDRAIAHAYAKGAAYNVLLPMKDAQMALL